MRAAFQLINNDQYCHNYHQWWSVWWIIFWWFSPTVINIVIKFEVLNISIKLISKLRITCWNKKGKIWSIPKKLISEPTPLGCWLHYHYPGLELRCLWLCNSNSNSNNNNNNGNKNNQAQQQKQQQQQHQHQTEQQQQQQQRQ